MISGKVREHCGRAFTLVELLVALMVASFILTVVMTLAFATSTAIDSSDDTAEKQAEVRYATLTISELVRQCKLVCGTSGNDLAIWKSDNDNDGKIDITELVYIETGSKSNYIQFLDYPDKKTWLPQWLKHPKLSDIQSPWFKTILKWYYQERYVIFVKECSNARILLDVDPPKTEFISISFELQESDATHQYQISASLRTRAGHLLDSNDQIVSDDD